MKANQVVLSQKEAHETSLTSSIDQHLETHTTANPLTRFLRDRRLNYSIQQVVKYLSVEIELIKDWKILIVCGGTGGEGVFFANLGFRDITNSDISETALKICETLDPRLKTVQLNAENLDFPDGSFDLVVVQDGLHHLSRPTLGFTEMLRVSSRVVIVLEPRSGIVGKLLGHEWEKIGDAINYVFRWNQNILMQVSKSYLLKDVKIIKAIRFWDHSLAMLRIINKFPQAYRLSLAKMIYAFLNTFLNYFGNNMIGLVIKK